MDTTDNIGERIKQRRLELNLTQDELAQKVGYKSRSSINKIELSRSLPLKKIEKMAKALETTPGFLMGWHNNTPSDDLIKLASTYEKGVDYSVEIDNRLYLTIEMDLIRYARLISHDEEYVLKEGDTDEKT